MATDELHGGVALRRLLPEDGAGEHRVIPALLPQVDFNLEAQERDVIACWLKPTGTEKPSKEEASHGQLVFMCPHAAALPLLDHLLDVHQNRQRHTP